MSDHLKPLAASLQPLIASSAGLPSSTAPLQARAIYAAERARLLFGQFRKSDANDPETYVASVAAVLAQYRDDVIRQATDPRTGIAAYQDWPPNMKEIREFCTEIVEAEAAASRRERDLEHQVAGRAAYDAARAKAPTSEEIMAKAGIRARAIDAIPPAALFEKVRVAKINFGDAVTVSDDTRAILTAAGYRI